MKAFRHLLCLILLLAGFIPAAAQDAKSGVTLLAMDGGVLWVDNAPSCSFTLQIKGKQIRPTSEFPYLKVDDQVIQIRTPTQAEWHPTKSFKPGDDRAMIVSHQRWEYEYLEKMTGKKMGLRGYPAWWVQTQAGKWAAVWSLSTLNKDDPAPMPEQLYASAVCGERVVLLGTFVNAKQSREEGWQYLKEAIVTLVTSDRPFDIAVLQKTLSEGKAPAQ